MSLMSSGVDLENSKLLKEYKFLIDGAPIVQSKESFAKIPGLIVSYEPDCMGLSDDGEACAKMKLRSCYFKSFYDPLHPLFDWREEVGD
jgi:hypothetical protein